MAKKFTIKKNRLRARARVRRQKLKVDAPLPQRKPSLAEQNRDVILKLEAALQA